MEKENAEQENAEQEIEDSHKAGDKGEDNDKDKIPTDKYEFVDGGKCGSIVQASEAGSPYII